MIVVRRDSGKWFEGPAWHLSVVTGSIWPKAAGFPQVDVAKLLIISHPGVGKKTNAPSQVTLNSHLLTVEEGNPIPTFAAPCNGSRETRIQIGRHRKRDRNDAVRHQSVVFHQGVHQFRDRLLNRNNCVGAAGGRTT
jgi:hypothetical protein